MKLFAVLALAVTTQVLAQWSPYPTPFPRTRPEDFCTQDQVRSTIMTVHQICEAKVSDFASEHSLSCAISRSDLYGCRVECQQGPELVAKLRIDVGTNCLSGKAKLRKTVIKWY